MASCKIPFKIAICHSISFVFFNTQAFSTYFKKYIDPDMERMGYWALKECSTDHLLTTNQAESFNAVLKRFTKNEKLAVDLMVLKLYEISKHFERRTARGLATSEIIRCWNTFGLNTLVRKFSFLIRRPPLTSSTAFDLRLQ